MCVTPIAASMANYTNAQILSAVLAKWGQPIVESFMHGKLAQLPFVANIESKIKSTGWVSPMWSLTKEISPMLSGLSAPIIEPLLSQYLQGVPDAMIPQLAHSLVDNAIKQGGLVLFEGKIELEAEDLEELQTLLRYNLPIQNCETYVVKESASKEQTEINNF